MIKKIPHFIIIDDDHINNLLNKTIISAAVGKNVDVNAFTHPEEGFKYIAAEHSKYANGNGTIILLDLNMPVMTGWDFLENFEELDEKIKKMFKIYILSSSDDPRDKRRAGLNKNVTDYLVKPLTKNIVEKIISSNS